MFDYLKELANSFSINLSPAFKAGLLFTIGIAFIVFGYSLKEKRGAIAAVLIIIVLTLIYSHGFSHNLTE